jgi:hypothetical protein
MPDRELFRFEPVVLNPPLGLLLSRPDVRVRCSKCNEEIINERECIVQGRIVCQACAGHGYYVSFSDRPQTSLIEENTFKPTIGGRNEPTTQAVSAIR